MSNNYQELDFKHFVVVTSEGAIFGSARAGGHIYNFLIRDGSIQQQSGDQWVDIYGQEAALIRERAQDAYSRTPTYRISSLSFN
jgi:hypothetical protein